MSRRRSSLVALVALGALGLSACASTGVDRGPNAFSLGDREVSQQSLDEELGELARNEQLQRLVTQGGGSPLSRSNGSIATELASGWLTLVIAQHVAAQEVDRRGLEVTSADREKARRLAAQSAGDASVYDALPDWFRDRLVDRWAPVAALQRDLVESSPEQIEAALAQQCPSGRYVSHLLVDTQDEAQTIKDDLDQGNVTFAKAARDFSTDEGSAVQDGQLGCVDGQQFVEPFATVAATQPPGVVSDPVQTEFGWHLIMVDDDPPDAVLDNATLGQILGRARGEKVEVDPRYGRWNRGQGQVVPPEAPPTDADADAAPLPVS